MTTFAHVRTVEPVNRNERVCECVTIEPQLLALHLSFVVIQISLAELAEGVGWQRLSLLLISTCVWLYAYEIKAQDQTTSKCKHSSYTPRRNMIIMLMPKKKPAAQVMTKIMMREMKV